MAKCEHDTATVPQTRNDPSELKIKTILVPLDFSHASVEALDYAVWLAKQFRAAIHLVHVYPPDEASSVPSGGHLLFETAETIERLNEELTGIHRKHVPTFRPENCHIRGGRPYEEIVQLAGEIDADLIVLSTRGHSGLKHLLLGSTAERVVRNAPCPVLVTRKRKQKSKANSKTFAIRTILVPTDFSQRSLSGTDTQRFWQRNLMPRCASFTRCIRIQITCSLIAPASVSPGWPKRWKKQPGRKWIRSSRWIFCAVCPFKPNFSPVSPSTKSVPQQASQMLISSSLPLTVGPD